MKKTAFLGATALALMTATTAHAEGGYVGGVYGNVDAGSLGDSDFWGIEGAVAGSNFELDGAILDGDSSDTALSLAGHMFARDDSHLFGGFVGVTDSGDSTTWTAGLEGNMYLDSWTLAGAVGYASNDDIDTDGFGVNAEARFFPTENLRLDAGLGWASVDAAGVDDDVVSYNLGGEYQLSAAPVSIGLNWGHSEADNTNIDADTITIGVRFNFSGTLRDRDRSGASQANLVGFGF